MKRISIILFIILCSLQADAQNFREWFRQKKTQREYLLKQIALLKVQIQQVKKGITIVQRGLKTIENVKNGDFNLHKDFFAYLNNVNPVISNSAKAMDIIVFQLYIVQNLKKTRDFCRGHKRFTPEELRYVADVYANMLILTAANLDELYTIIRPNKLKMSDDERLSQIDKLHTETLNQHAFVKAFDAEARLLAHERDQEALEAEWLAKQYDL